MTTTTVTYPANPTLVHYPHPTLRAPAVAVTDFDDELTRFLEGMFAVMYDQRGVGLAAPQVGVKRRIFVTDDRTEDGERVNPQAWINPRIEPLGGRRSGEEGCLSLPGLYGEVERHSDLFPPMVSQLIIVGEQTGELAPATAHIREHLRGEVRRKSTIAVGVIEPALTMSLALAVAVILLSIYLPMFDMINPVGK